MTDPKTEVVIAPRKGLSLPDGRELWEARELLAFLVLRNVRVRYKQSVLGIAWAVIQPVMTMAVFAIFFGGLAEVPSDGSPYYLFALAALVPWTLFATGFERSAESLISDVNLVTKVYFPRLVMPLSHVFASVADFAISFVMLLVVAMASGFPITPRILAIPLFVALAIAASMGAGLAFGATNVLFRDVRHVVPFLRQLWLFSTPIAYPLSLIDGQWQKVYALNPLVGVVEGFRWALLGTGESLSSTIWISAASGFTMLLVGLVIFHALEATFADSV